MFVSVALDLGSEDSRIKVADLLKQYGFRKIQNALFETTSLNEKNLARLKVDMDRLTDYYDLIRIYQYPVEETLVITSLEGKKWKRLVTRA